jgi:hypothetical protein
MAKFTGDIVYSEEIPSAIIPAVRAPTQVPTGTEAIAQGIAQLGRAFEVVGERYDTAELSTMKRQLDETTFAAFNIYSTTGNEAARKALVDKWSADVDKIQSKSNRVNTAFQAHKNSVLPEWGNTFAKQELAIKNRQADDADKINIQSSLEKGDLGEASKIIVNRQRLNRISEADADQQIKELPNEAALVQAEKLIGDQNGQGALDALGKAKDMTLKQVERWHKLNSWAKQVGKLNSDSAKDSAVNLMNKNDNTLGKDKEAIANQMMVNLQAAGVTGDDYLQWAGPNGVIERWKAGKFEVDSPEHLSQLNRDIRDVSLGYASRADVDDYIRKAVVDGFLTSKTAGELLKTNYDDFKKYQNSSLKDEVDYAENILIPKKRTAAMMSVEEILATEAALVDTAVEMQVRNDGYAKLQWVDEQLRDFVKKNPDSSGVDIHIQGRRLIAMAQAGKMGIQPEYVVHNDVEFRELPKGAVFLAPDGRVKVKP